MKILSSKDFEEKLSKLDTEKKLKINQFGAKLQSFNNAEASSFFKDAEPELLMIQDLLSVGVYFSISKTGEELTFNFIDIKND